MGIASRLGNAVGAVIVAALPSWNGVDTYLPGLPVGVHRPCASNGGRFGMIRTVPDEDAAVPGLGGVSLL